MDGGCSSGLCSRIARRVRAGPSEIASQNAASFTPRRRRRHRLDRRRRRRPGDHRHAHSARADEGMWTFDNFPIQTVNDKYGTRIDQAWLDRVRNSAVRIQGCSASFVSGEGLILTNWHCVVGCVQELSSPEQRLREERLHDGDPRRGEALPGPDGRGAGRHRRRDRPGAGRRRRAGRRGLQRRPHRRDQRHPERGLRRRSEVQLPGHQLLPRRPLRPVQVPRYDDVRLVFAPENQAAFFGGDPDNFNFPRYALDAGFLRAYEDGKPVETANFLKLEPERSGRGRRDLRGRQPRLDLSAC